MKSKWELRYNFLRAAAIFCLILAALLIVWLFVMRISAIQTLYADFEAFLLECQDWVLHLGYKWLILLVLFFIMILRGVIPFAPFSTIFLITGLVFPTPATIAINTVGILIILTIRYYYGKILGGGRARKILYRYDTVKQILSTEDGDGNLGLLFLLRIVPTFPFNTVSQLYGSMKTDFRKYLLISFAGFLPRLISYSMIGRHVYNPFSAAFLLPIIIILIISGIAILGFNEILTFIIKKKL